MTTILITLMDGSQVYSKSLHINKLGDVCTDTEIYDICNIGSIEVIWVDVKTVKSLKQVRGEYIGSDGQHIIN